MLIKYDSTVDELIEAQEMLAARSKTISSWRFRGAAVSSIISAAIIAVPLIVIAFFIPPLTYFLLVLAVVLGSLTAYSTWDRYHTIFRKLLRKYLNEQLGDKETFPFEIEINESEIRIKQMETRIIYEWSNVEEVKEIENKLVFYLRNGGIILVRKKHFPELETFEKFHTEVIRHLNYSRTSSNWLRGDEI